MAMKVARVRMAILILVFQNLGLDKMPFMATPRQKVSAPQVNNRHTERGRLPNKKVAPGLGGKKCSFDLNTPAATAYTLKGMLLSGNISLFWRRRVLAPCNV